MGNNNSDIKIFHSTPSVIPPGFKGTITITGINFSKINKNINILSFVNFDESFFTGTNSNYEIINDTKIFLNDNKLFEIIEDLFKISYPKHIKYYVTFSKSDNIKPKDKNSFVNISEDATLTMINN